MKPATAVSVPPPGWKTGLGYAWAALAVPILLTAFIAREPLALRLAALTEVKISPWYSGGAVVNTIARGDYRLAIHEPVFEALFGETFEGFVQVDIAAAGADTANFSSLPAMISETIAAFPGDEAPTFLLRLAGGGLHAEVTPLSPLVMQPPEVTKLADRVAIRVPLRNPKHYGR